MEICCMAQETQVAQRFQPQKTSQNKKKGKTTMLTTGAMTHNYQFVKCCVLRKD